MKVIDVEDLPKYIRRLRGSQSQAEYGKSLGISKQAVTLYESGVNQPKPDVLAKLGLVRCYRLVKPEAP